MNRGGFSWKRFLGISAAKAIISRKIGIPLTKSGRDQKIGRMITRRSFLVVMLFPLALLIATKLIFWR
jgi:hypothetical protein